MHTSSIFLLVALSVLTVVSASGRNNGVQEQGNIWSEKLVGKKLILAKDEEATENFDPETEYKESDLPSPYRIIRPRTAVTMDYRTNRLNVHIDANNIITRVYFA